MDVVSQVQVSKSGIKTEPSTSKNSGLSQNAAANPELPDVVKKSNFSCNFVSNFDFLLNCCSFNGYLNFIA